MPTLPENATIEEIRELFVNDRFATEAAGCRIVEGSRGHAVCEMEITPRHRNAAGGVMGGAIFTLADYALAVACNVGEEPSVSVTHSIEFISAAKGTKLIATCETDKSGRRMGFYNVEVKDDTGRLVARMIAMSARI